MANGNRPIRTEFTVHKLNEQGMQKAEEIAAEFSELLTSIEQQVGLGAGGREMALVRTNLQLASFYAKRAIAEQPANQLVE